MPHELPLPDGLIFDLDGTLVDTVRARIDGWIEALGQAGLETTAAKVGPMIVDGSHVENAKPAPDLLLLAAQRLGAAPATCWAVGDSTWDVQAALAAGMTPIGVTAGSAVSAEDLRAAGAAVVVPTLAELATLLDETCRG